MDPRPIVHCILAMPLADGDFIVKRGDPLTLDEAVDFIRFGWQVSVDAVGTDRAVAAEQAEVAPMAVRVCRYCGSTNIRASMLKSRRYICDGCLPETHRLYAEKYTERTRRYEASEKGAARRRRRLWIGRTYVGNAESIARADAINRHL